MNNYNVDSAGFVLEVTDNPIKEFLMSVPIPDSTRTYKSVSHTQLMEVTLESLSKCGFDLHKEIYTSGQQGLVANGRYHLNFGNDPDMGLMIAWQNSYNKKVTLKFAVGNHIFICSNGMIVSDMSKFKSKHVGEIQFIAPKQLAEDICKAGDHFETMIKQKERLKEIEITKRVTSELLGRLFIDDAIITSTQLNIIKEELKRPTFDYGYENSAWNLLNFITYSQKTAAPETWIEKSMATHHFFLKEFSL